jgi:hypothetical protein
VRSFKSRRFSVENALFRKRCYGPTFKTATIRASLIS